MSDGTTAAPAPSGPGASSAAGPRNGWVLATLPDDCRHALVLGDDELADQLRDAGISVARRVVADEPTSTDAIVVAEHPTTEDSELAALASRLTPGGVLAVALAQPAEPPDRVTIRHRMKDALRRPAVATGVVVRARQVEARLEKVGLDVERLAAGELSRAHSLGAGTRAVRLPRAMIVVGRSQPSRGSVLEAALEAVESELSCARPVSATVRGSGALLVDLAASEGARWMLRLGTGAGARLMVSAERNVGALTERAPAAVRDRIPPQLAVGVLRWARYSVEPKAAGRVPRYLKPRLWREALEFLIALRHDANRPWAPGSLSPLVATLSPHVDALGQQTLVDVAQRLDQRLEGVTLGWAHGDLWPGNLLAHNGRLTAVLDWDSASPHALPLLDMFHLIAWGERRYRPLSLGAFCESALWPLAQDGGDQRIRSYCEATGTPRDAETLEALAQAYWLVRAAREVGTFADRAKRPAWMEANVHRPLAALAGL